MPAKEEAVAGARLLLSYNIIPQYQQEYMNFVITEMIPALENMGVKNAGVWHTAYGDYPVRLLVFVSDDATAMQHALATSTWESMEKRLKGYTTDYTRRLVPNDSRFRF